MNSNSILNSNLLDIIFENRNKDYGAYILRRGYNKRLLKSLLAAMAFVVMFFCLQMLTRKNISTNVSSVIIPDVLISSPYPMEKRIEPKKIIHPQVKSAKILDMKAVIVKNLEEKAAPPNDQMPGSNIGNNSEASPFEVPGSDGDNTGEEIKEPVKAATPVIDREVPVNNPEVLPQYPGGINELIKFLRRNLNTPQELQEGEEIAVKVKFIVNYNGKLMGFDVVKSGGEPFDNEVIRVLKKMHEWIPGKSNGENVSAYFIVPVKFTVSN